jgi:hypothetical protein
MKHYTETYKILLNNIKLTKIHGEAFQFVNLETYEVIISKSFQIELYIWYPSPKEFQQGLKLDEITPESVCKHKALQQTWRSHPADLQATVTNEVWHSCKETPVEPWME